MGQPTRWVTDTADGHSQWYVDHFRGLADDGADLGGEARLLDAMVARESRLLDAGCGGGRVGAVLHERGHTVVGVDADPVLVAAAIEDHPDARWIVGDLSDFDLTASGIEEPFDAAILAGNVMPYVADGTQVAVLSRVAAHLRSGAVILVGFGTGRGYSLDHFDDHIAQAGLTLEHRFATWSIDPWRADSDFAVSALRVV